MSTGALKDPQVILQARENPSILEEVIRESQPLLRAAVGKLIASGCVWATYFDREDLLQEASIILMRCIDHYTPERGVHFPTYLMRALRQNLWRVVQRAQERTTYALPLEEGTAAVSPDSYSGIEGATALAQFYQQLTSQQKEILTAYYLTGGNIQRTVRSTGVPTYVVAATVAILQRRAKAAVTCLPPRLFKRHTGRTA